MSLNVPGCCTLSVHSPKIPVKTMSSSTANISHFVRRLLKEAVGGERWLDAGEVGGNHGKRGGL